MNPINSATSTNSTTATNSQGQSLNQLTGNDFMTLLTTQLQSQDPTQPEDPNEMVDQLVSFNSLQQLISINQSLQQLTTATATPSTSGAQTSANAAAANAAQQILSL